MILFRKYKAIVYVATTYGMLQYLLLSPHKQNEAIFIFQPDYSKNRDNLSKKFHVPRPFRIASDNKYRLTIQALFIRFYSVLFPRADVFISGDTALTNILIHCFTNVYRLEDGTRDYLPKDDNAIIDRGWRRRTFLKEGRGSIELRAKIQKYYMTGILPIPQKIADKVEIINLQTLWQNKTEQQRALINYLLIPETVDFEALQHRSVLLITQPFSEQAKIEAYTTLLAPYDQKQVAIKTHPRETTDYKKYFPDAHIINEPFPVELLSLNKKEGFKVAISINSTAVYSFGKDVEKIVSGIKAFPRLHEEFTQMLECEGISAEKFINTKQL